MQVAFRRRDYFYLYDMATEPTPPITFKLSTGIYILIGAVAIILFFTFKHCNSDRTVDYIPPTQASLDSIAALKRTDSINNKWRIDSLIMAGEFKDYEKQLLTDALLKNGMDINYLAGLIKAVKKDAPIYQQACDSLAMIAPVYVKTVDSFTKAVVESDKIHEAERAAWRESDSLVQVAYLSVVDVAVQSKEAFEAYRKAHEPRVTVLVGFSATYNPFVYGVGPSIAVQGKKGGVISGSVQFTNHQRLYQAGYLVPIRLRKK